MPKPKSTIAPREDAAKTENLYYQQLHEGCGGVIVIAYNGSGMKCICADCTISWSVITPFDMAIARPQGWSDYRPNIKVAR